MEIKVSKYKRLYDKRKANHLCGACGKKLPDGYTFTTCEDCRARNKVYYRVKDRSAYWSAYYASMAERRIKRESKGLCPRCGRKLCETDGYKLMCGICRLEERIRKRTVREMRESKGLCSRCGKQNDRAGRKTCSECAKMMSEYGKRQRELGIRRKR